MPKRVSNPPNPWESTHREWIGEPPPVKLHVFEECARTIVTENNSPDIPFRFGVNPYRGCFHGCAYCYARPTHQHLGFGAGTDFDRKLVVKTNAPELLDAELTNRRVLRGATIHFSGNTDCYQPIEASYTLTRRCLEVCAHHKNPITIITKGNLVRRDIDVLARVQEHATVRVTVSIPFADRDHVRKIEPFAASPSDRFETIRLLTAAGIEAGVTISPIIPGLNDDQIPRILEAAKAAGATLASFSLLRLPGEVRAVFEERLKEAYPGRYRKILAALLEARDGKVTDPRFGHRMTGIGQRWQVISRLFETTARRLGLSHRPLAKEDDPKPPPRPSPQGTLFDL